MLILLGALLVGWCHVRKSLRRLVAEQQRRPGEPPRNGTSKGTGTGGEGGVQSKLGGDGSAATTPRIEPFAASQLQQEPRVKVVVAPLDIEVVQAQEVFAAADLVGTNERVVQSSRDAQAKWLSGEMIRISAAEPASHWQAP